MPGLGRATVTGRAEADADRPMHPVNTGFFEAGAIAEIEN
jgi:hypothetical protein